MIGMDDKMTILVVGGHPADVFDHCGGTLAHHIRKGDSVTCLTLTQGLRIHDEVVSEVFRFGTQNYSREDIKRICEEREQVKLNEVKEACALFGITDVRSLRYDDKFLMVTEELINALAKVIREVKPDLLITHWPKENGNTMAHHGNTAKIAIAAAALAGTVDFEDPNPAWRITDIAFMLHIADTTASQALDIGEQARPNYYVDITDVADLKAKALSKMKSQRYDQGKYPWKITETQDGGFGTMCWRPYCEAFVLNKPFVEDTIKLSKNWRTRANEPELDKMARDFNMMVPYDL
jgi:4-oxalomesaconate hydratase